MDTKQSSLFPKKPQRQITLKDGTPVTANDNDCSIWTDHQMRVKGFRGTKVYKRDGVLYAYSVEGSSRSKERIATAVEKARWEEVEWET
jgi:hypothetical protein